MKREIYAILAIMFGWCGAQYFYDKQIAKGIACIVFSWTMIPSLIGLVQGLTALTEEDTYFRYKHGKNKTLLND